MSDVAAPAVHATTSQTVGPYLHIGLAPRYNADIAFEGESASAIRVVIEGRLLDGNGDAMPDGMIEVWQADAKGRYAHPHDALSGHDDATRSAFGFGRVPTESDGSFRFSTVKPGRVAAPDGSRQAPHLVVAVFARGLLKHLSTRLYFADEVDANAADFVLQSVPAPRRASLIAAVAGPGLYRWTVRLQADAERETVFFDY